MAVEYDTGVIHGRFQILHNDHLRYLLAGKQLCGHLVVGITNPDPSLTREDQADAHRSDVLANPLTYFERYVMVRAVLEQAGVKSADFSVVPLPINLPELYRFYVPLEGVFFLTIYDRWGRKKLENFQKLGLKVHVLWECSSEDKGLSASEVRRRMIFGEPWQEMVPQPVAELVGKWDVPARLKRLQDLEMGQGFGRLQ